MDKKHILTIAGSDPSGGAGIQADLKTITCLGGYGMTVITALTAQNPREVRAVHQVPIGFLTVQLDTVLDRLAIDAVKTGMLPNGECIELVAERIRRYDLKRTVIDPVVISASGARLIDDRAMEALIRRLFPLAGLVTPNLDEASLIADMEIRNPEDMRRAAERIHVMGPRAVLIKGGHLSSVDALDVLRDETGLREFRTRRVPSRALHGTGCTMASAIATLWAQGNSLTDAVGKAKAFLTKAIEKGVIFDDGPGTPDQAAFFDPEKVLAVL